MLSPDTAVGLALDIAREGLEEGEMPIGAVVFDGERVLGRSHTKEKALGRRIVHADLLAMEEADRALGFAKPVGELTLAVNLEPCLMCMGAAVTLGVKRIWYSLESPNDGADALLKQWAPPVEQQFFAKPREIIGGIRRADSKAVFAEYASGDGPPGMRAWARSLA